MAQFLVEMRARNKNDPQEDAGGSGQGLTAVIRRFVEQRTVEKMCTMEKTHKKRNKSFKNWLAFCRVSGENKKRARKESTSRLQLSQIIR